MILFLNVSRFPAVTIRRKCSSPSSGGIRFSFGEGIATSVRLAALKKQPMSAQRSACRCRRLLGMTVTKEWTDTCYADRLLIVGRRAACAYQAQSNQRRTRHTGRGTPSLRGRRQICRCGSSSRPYLAHVNQVLVWPRFSQWDRVREAVFSHKSCNAARKLSCYYDESSVHNLLVQLANWNGNRTETRRIRLCYEDCAVGLSEAIRRNLKEIQAMCTFIQLWGTYLWLWNWAVKPAGWFPPPVVAPLQKILSISSPHA